MKQKVICIACSIFKNELAKIKNKASFNFEVLYLDSMLHMYPKKLKEQLHKKTEQYSDHNIILLYGDCHATMHELENEKNIYRSPGINCCNIVLENKRYKKLRKDGAFILMDEWVERWEHIFTNELGFTKKETARMFMQEMHTKLVYLDAGHMEVPVSTLEAISEYCGLPYYIEKTNPNNLEKVIIDALNWFEHEN